MVEAIIMNLTVLSTAFAMGSAIPAEYTCSGADISPPLSWSEVPEATQSIAIICHDPDAPVGDWSHWVIWNLSPQLSELPQRVPPKADVPGGAVQGINDFGRHGYGGPCPPPGKPHRYFFKVFALDSKLELDSSSEKEALLKAMKGHILAQGELMGTFQR